MKPGSKRFDRSGWPSRLVPVLLALLLLGLIATLLVILLSVIGLTPGF
jgi:uncharacterized membrane protein